MPNSFEIGQLDYSVKFDALASMKVWTVQGAGAALDFGRFFRYKKVSLETCR